MHNRYPRPPFVTQQARADAQPEIMMTPPSPIKSYDNHVYFYAEVSSENCLDLIRTIREVDGQLRNERVSRSIPDSIESTPIWLHIQSYGGDAFAGLGMADQLRTIKTPIYSVIEGIAASAATLMAVSCTRRHILPRSFMMIHQLSSMFWGTHEQFKDEMNMQTMAMQQITECYVAHSNLSEGAVGDMLRRDSWLSSDQALADGFVDEILR